MKRIIILLSILLISGCTGYKELSDLAVVTAFSIDKNKEDYILNVQIVNTSSSKETKITTKVYESKGKTIFDAARNLNNKISSTLFNSNLKYIVLSKNIIENDLDNIIDYLSRDSHLPLNFLVLTSNNIKDVLDIDKEVEIENLLKLSLNKNGNTIVLYFKDLLFNYLNNKDILIPSIDINNNTLEVSSTYMLKDKLYILSEEEVKSYLLLNNLVNNIIFTFKCKNSNNYYSIETLSTNKTKNKLDIKVKLVSYDCEEDIKDINNINKLEILTKNNITNILSENLIVNIKIIKEGNILGDLYE